MVKKFHYFSLTQLPFMGSEESALWGKPKLRDFKDETMDFQRVEEMKQYQVCNCLQEKCSTILIELNLNLKFFELFRIQLHTLKRLFYSLNYFATTSRTTENSIDQNNFRFNRLNLTSATSHINGTNCSLKLKNSFALCNLHMYESCV